jgi:hypothetical protein
MQRLELELDLLRSQLSDWQHLKASCEKVGGEPTGAKMLLKSTFEGSFGELFFVFFF